MARIVDSHVEPMLAWVDLVTPVGTVLIGWSIAMFVGTLWLSRLASKQGRSREVLIAGTLVSLVLLILLMFLLFHTYTRWISPGGRLRKRIATNDQRVSHRSSTLWR